jgi:ABC-type Zn2+ transport system substrate-binding protein/surface adhesin
MRNWQHDVGTAAIAAVFCLAGIAPASAGETVLAALQPLLSLTAALAEGTSIVVKGVPGAPPGMSRLQRALNRPDAVLDQQMKSASAVISIASVWPDDPLYREARGRNFRIVSIDAARALDKSGASVALVRQPVNTRPWRAEGDGSGTSPYVWLAPSNAIRMADIVTADLARLSPMDEAKLRANHSDVVRDLQALRAEYEKRLVQLDDTRVFALSDHFVYLTNEFGFDVEGYFLEDDVRWTDADLARLTKLLQEQGIKVVIHHWEPSEPIRRAIANGGARLVVLNDGDNPSTAQAGSNAYRDVMRADLEALCNAISP